MGWYSHRWAPYVPVAERRRRAVKKMASLRKKGANVQPVEIEGRKIAKTFWGEAWCDHLESFHDYENRLPRGRTYVRNGSVCHLAIAKGKIEAKVIGSDIYNLRIKTKTLSAKKWNGVKRRCAGQIGSLLELLQGNLSDNVMAIVTDRKNGLFPLPGEISFDCDCPDWAIMCKHVAAALYGVGARLDDKPELLFKLRGVNHKELIDTDAEITVPSAKMSKKSKRLDGGDLPDIFGIDIAVNESGKSLRNTRKKKVLKKMKASIVKRAAKKKTVKKVTEKVATKKAATKKSAQKHVKKKAVGKSIGTKGVSRRTAKKKTVKNPVNKTTKKAAKKKVKKKAVGKSISAKGASRRAPKK